MKNKSDIISLWKMEYDFCKNDLLYFVSNYCCFEDRDAKGLIVRFSPWEEQKNALIDIRDNRLVLFLKARQVGVTWITLFYCAWDMIYNPGHSILALSKTKDDANELVRRLGVIFDNMKPLLSAGCISVRLKKDSVILKKDGIDTVFRSLAASPSAGRSLTASIVVIDEWAFQTWAREIWTAAYPTVNRPDGGKVIGISTIKRGTLFEELWESGKGWHKKFISVFADPRRDEAFYERTRADLGELIRQEYPRTAQEALSNTEGRFFPEFNISDCVCAPFQIPPDYRIYTAMDYGLDMLAHYRFAVDSRRFVYVFDEIYQSGLVVSEAARLIKASDILSPFCKTAPYVRLAPPDLFSRGAYNGKSEADGFLENGVVLVRSSNNRTAGWINVKELLKKVQNPDGSFSPRLKIFSCCPNLIRTLSQISVDKNTPIDAARDPHELTHAPDALRYFAVYWWQSNENAADKPHFAHPDMEADYERMMSLRR